MFPENSVFSRQPGQFKFNTAEKSDTPRKQSRGDAPFVCTENHEPLSTIMEVQLRHDWRCVYRCLKRDVVRSD